MPLSLDDWVSSSEFMLTSGTVEMRLTDGNLLVCYLEYGVGEGDARCRREDSACVGIADFLNSTVCNKDEMT